MDQVLLAAGEALDGVAGAAVQDPHLVVVVQQDLVVAALRKQGQEAACFVLDQGRRARDEVVLEAVQETVAGHARKRRPRRKRLGQGGDVGAVVAVDFAGPLCLEDIAGGVSFGDGGGQHGLFEVGGGAFLRCGRSVRLSKR